MPFKGGLSLRTSREPCYITYIQIFTSLATAAAKYFVCFWRVYNIGDEFQNKFAQMNGTERQEGKRERGKGKWRSAKSTIEASTERESSSQAKPRRVPARALEAY